MSLKVTLNKSDKGPASKFAFHININYECDTYSAEVLKGPFTVNKLLTVTFKFSRSNATISRNRTSAVSSPVKVSILVKKLSFDEKLSKLHVSCQVLNFSKQLHVYNGDQDWQVIGSISGSGGYAEHVIEVNMIASITETFNFAKLYQDTELTDFLLRSEDGGTVSVHKACLAVHSDVFKRMLLSKCKETTEDCIEFKDLTLQTLQHLKDYVYLGILPDDGMEPLLLLAKCYMMTNLLEDVVNKICQSTTAENLYSLLQLATENNIPELALGLLQMASDDAVNYIVMKKPEPKAAE